ncbi:hypothetical protein MSP8887_01193 [Marinomonas spartinae]|uniref:hypothetical protein n=1 Tax=Marinomonas spartinae TaxID=1792290 RepID=UPI0008090811|nr:hypothetical protein [Marinomonas spartinae]SBS29934.1 hypothetical protein MSP8887_01193 [Marinomonas spartinae]
MGLSPSWLLSRKMLRVALSILCCLLVVFLAAKELGTYYSKKIIDERLEHAGLRSFVHYKAISFSPFTLTPTLQSVSLGNEHYPWLAFRTISLKWLPLIYPDLRVSFQFDPHKSLARDSRRLLSKLGIDALKGSGLFTSNKIGRQLTSKLNLTIEQVGTLHWKSRLDLLTNTLSLQEFRSDLLASIALRQMSAMPIIYGDSVAFDKVSIRFHDTGLVHHLFPLQKHPAQKRNQMNITSTLEKVVDEMGLAKAGSHTSQLIVHQLLSFWHHPETLTFVMAPSKALSLKEIMLLSQNKQLYAGAKLSVTTHSITTP